MKILATILAIFVCAAPSFAASTYDRPALVKSWEKKCEQDHLERSSDMTNLAILQIPLAAVCECISTQVVSRMSDDDITYMTTQSTLNQATVNAYNAARKLCIVTLMH
jgi:hypothetical protein